MPFTFLNVCSLSGVHKFFNFSELIEFDTVWDQLIAVCDIEKVRDYIIYMASDLPYELAEKPVYVFLYSHLLSHLLKDEQVSSMGLEFFHSISKFYRKCDKVSFMWRLHLSL